jgi:archaellin
MFLRVSGAAVVTFGLLLTGCGSSSQAANPESPDAEDGSKAPEKVDVKAQFKRESDPIAKQPVDGKGNWSAYIEAKSPPQVIAHDQFLEVVADLGWESEVHCFVYQEGIDAAGAVHTMLQAASQSVEFQAVTPYALERDGLVPMIGVRGIYQVKQNEVLMAGDYKLMVMPRSDFPVLCVHDAAGYAVSFIRVTTEFARSFKFETETLPVVRGELWSVTLDETPVGFSQHTTYQVAGGNLRRVSLSASFIPTAPGQLALEDRVSIVNSDAAGNLIDGKYITFENGETSLSLDIERAKQNYNYVGTVQNKDVRGTFKSKKPVMTEYAFEKRIKGIAKKPQKTSFEQLEYTPGIDPAQPSKVTYEVTPEEGAVSVIASVGQRAVMMHANSKGVIDKLKMPVGARNVESNLLEEVGDL